MIKKALYEIRFDGKVIRGKNLSEIRALSNSTTCYYEIYKVYQSAMKSPPRRLMNIQDVQEANRMVARGYAKQTVADHFSVSADYLRKVLKSLHKNQTIEL